MPVLPQPPDPHPAVLKAASDRIDSLRGESLQTRAEAGVDLHRHFKAMPDTPEVRALMRRVYVELLDMKESDLDNLDERDHRETEPHAEAATYDPETGGVKGQQWAILMMADADPDGNYDGTVTRVYVTSEQKAEAYGPRLATLHAQDYQLLPVSDLPEEFTAALWLGEVREIIVKAHEESAAYGAADAHARREHIYYQALESISKLISEG